MGATTLGIPNHESTAGKLLGGSPSTGKPIHNAAGNGQASVSNGEAATISANDFLTLLVTEMRNQDPTATTDPNEYINQLVQVNSLEQLISINQTLIADSGGSPSPSAATSSGATIHRNAVSGAETVATAGTHATAVTDGAENRTCSVSGNLSISPPYPSAQRVARSLGGENSIF